jgi:hypothetical protein
MSPPLVILLAIVFSLTWLAGLVAIWTLSPLLGACVLVLMIYATYELMKDAGEL